jgi:superfamily II DNA helicase RecQ
MLLNERMLDRLVLDECHLYLTSNNSYRPDMMNVTNLIRLHAIQTVLLTATLPLTCQSVLFEKLELDETTATILRDPTIRKNIRYEVSRIGTQKWLPQVENVLHEPRFQNERIIIYVQTIFDGEKIADYLSLPFYYADAPNKMAIMEQWMVASMNRIIVATSAMGCGMDIPDIRLVLHAGTPSSMIEFAQQSGSNLVSLTKNRIALNLERVLRNSFQSC